MKVTIFGASGATGTSLARQALTAGHEVTATRLRSAAAEATFATSRTFTLILSSWAAASGAELTGKTASLRG